MGVLEEKKAKLGVTGLNPEKQSELYEDFVNIGGKVVELQPDQKNKLNTKLENWIEAKEEEEKLAKIREERQRNEELARRRHQAEKERMKRLAADRANQEQAQAVQKQAKQAVPKVPHPTEEYFSRLAAKIVCILYGILSLFGKKFTHSFIQTTLMELHNSLQDTRQILASLLHQDKVFSAELRRRLSSEGFPFYYELLFRFDGIYEEELFESLKKGMFSKEPEKQSRASLIQLFKKILVINRYHPSLKNAFEKILREEEALRSLPEEIILSNLRKLNRAYNLVFMNYYPRLVNLIDYYYKDEIVFGRRVSYKEFINITEMDNIGYYNKFWAEEEEKEKQRKELEEKARQEEEERKKKDAKDNNDEVVLSDDEIEEELQGLPENVRSGLRMIRSNVNFGETMAYYKETNDPRRVLAMNDKVFLYSALSEFFDKEFSFLFISSQVQYNVVSNVGHRVDMRNTLKDLYFKIDDNFKKLAEYLRIIGEQQRLNDDTYILPKEQYARMQQLSLQRSQTSKLIRAEGGAIMSSFQKQLEFLLTDYEYEKRIIQNPEEVINFDTRILGRRINHKLKIIEALANAYYYASALHYLLTDQELSGIYVTLNNPVYLKLRVPEGDEDEGK